MLSLHKQFKRPAVCRGHITFTLDNHVSVSAFVGFVSLAYVIKCKNMVKPDALRVLEGDDLLLDSYIDVWTFSINLDD